MMRAQRDGGWVLPAEGTRLDSPSTLLIQLHVIARTSASLWLQLSGHLFPPESPSPPSDYTSLLLPIAAPALTPALTERGSCHRLFPSPNASIHSTPLAHNDNNAHLTLTILSAYTRDGCRAVSAAAPAE